MITVRAARPSDAESLAALNYGFNGVQRHPGRVRQSLLAERSSEIVFVAEKAGAIVGFVCLQTLHSMCYDEPWVEITELYVAPNHRRNGAGSALLREAQVCAESAGASEILLRSNMNNIAARVLCNQIGLDPVPHVVLRRSYVHAVQTESLKLTNS